MGITAWNQHHSPKLTGAHLGLAPAIPLVGKTA
jgi:hypothetical protein